MSIRQTGAEFRKVSTGQATDLVEVQRYDGTNQYHTTLNVAASNLVPPFTGATALTNGVAGTVPAPMAGEEGYFLKGDGSWSAAGGAGYSTILHDNLAFPNRFDMNFVGDAVSVSDNNVSLATDITFADSLNDIAALSPTVNNVIVGDGTNFTLAPYDPFEWVVVTSDENILPNRGYIVNGGAQITLTLPATFDAGQEIKIVGLAGGWKVEQNAGQVIHFGNLSTTIGSMGELVSTHDKDCVSMVTAVQDTDLIVMSASGNIDVE